MPEGIYTLNLCIEKTILKDILIKGYRIRNPDKKIDFFYEDIALITLQIKLILSPEKGQSFRPIQPICLLTESIETKDDYNLKLLQSEAWNDELIDFTIAGKYVYTWTLHNSDWTTNNAALCKFRVEQDLLENF